MESNGKRVRVGGATVMGATGPIVFGEPGTNGQHAFYQLLHQGTDVVPCDFMVAARSDVDDDQGHQALLLANCLAQSEALMRGKTLAEVKAELKAQGMSAARHRLAGAAQGLSGQPPVQHHPLPPARPGDARQADRALRAQDLRRGRHLGDQLLRPVGRRARQDARRAAPADGRRQRAPNRPRQLDGGAAGHDPRCCAACRLADLRRCREDRGAYSNKILGGLIVRARLDLNRQMAEARHVG